MKDASKYRYAAPVWEFMESVLDAAGYAHTFDGEAIHLSLDDAGEVDLHIILRQSQHEGETFQGVVILTPIRTQVLPNPAVFEWAVKQGQSAVYGRLNVWEERGNLDVVFSIALEVKHSTRESLLSAVLLADRRCRALRARFTEDFGAPPEGQAR